MKSILEFNHTEARQYLLKEESYFNFDLPHYFVFKNLIQKISDKLVGRTISDFYGNYTDEETGKVKVTFPANFENVNYKFLNNKDGKFAWRPFQLIHPALYVSLVNLITEEDNWIIVVNRFIEFRDKSVVECLSLPIESENELSDKATTINKWWQQIEQQSITLALDYEYVLHTDIADCYGSIYTHSVVWALHTKAVGKAEKGNKKLLGNVIDKHLQDMAYGQTNGIPQGSVLMDMIAEMVLGFADLELSERIKKLGLKDFKILRYRDDYRVFSNNPQESELILKNITEVLIELSMRLNAQKTLISNSVIKDSLKSDKLYWMLNKKTSKNIQENLLIIHDLSLKHPNSGSLTKSLTIFFNRIKKFKKTNQNINVLSSIIVDIAYKNPRTYPISSAILSKLLSLLPTDPDRNKILDSIKNRFNKIPNTGHLQIWLQRITLKIEEEKEYEELLCKKVVDSEVQIWNSDWLNEDFRKIICYVNDNR